MRISFFILICTLFTSFLSAQDLSFVNYSTKDGMSSSQVYQMFQDKNGDMLFATDRGITKFDGYTFQRFDTSDGLTNTTVFKFFPQENGNIWCSTIDNSWFYFKNGTTDFKPCKLNSLIQNSSFGGQAEDLWINSENDLYIGFQNIPDFLKINTKTKKIEHPLKLNYQKFDTLNAVFVKTNKWFKYNELDNRPGFDWHSRETIKLKQPVGKNGYKKIENINGKFLFSTSHHLLLCDKDNAKINLNFLSNIIGLGKFDENHFWVSFLEGGVRIFNMSGNETQHWLNGLSVTNLFVDSNKGIWVSTLSNGVYYAQSDELITHKELKGKFIYSISPGVNNEALINSLSQNYQFDGKTLRKLNIKGDFKGKKYVYNLESKTYNSNVPKSKIVKNNKIVNEDWSIIDFSENKKSPLLIASPFAFFIYKHGFFSGQLVKTRITAIEYADNGLFIGGMNGLQYFNFSDSTFSKLNHEAFNHRISDIKFKDGIHFIGTNGAGLIKYNQSTGKVIRVTQKTGLTSNIINEIFAESNTIVWIATNSGLNRVHFTGDKYIIQHFGVENGLIDNDVTDLYVHNDIVWIGTRTGLYSISKKDFKNKNQPKSLHLFWESIHMKNRKIDLPANLKFAHDENNLEINFHSAYFGGKERVKYRYKILSTNNSWHELSERKIILNELSAGNYKLILQANIDKTGWHTHQIELNFKILPPFHQTWWFQTIILALISFLLYLFFRFRVLIYNRTMVKEVLRLIIRKLNPKTNTFVIQEQGKSHRVESSDILFMKSEGNYLTLQLKAKKFNIRYKIGDFELLVPDKNEFVRVHKSYIVRIDNITGKNQDTIYINEIEIPIGKTYKKELKDLIF